MTGPNDLFFDFANTFVLADAAGCRRILGFSAGAEVLVEEVVGGFAGGGGEVVG